MYFLCKLHIPTTSPLLAVPAHPTEFPVNVFPLLVLFLFFLQFLCIWSSRVPICSGSCNTFNASLGFPVPVQCAFVLTESVLHLQFQWLYLKSQCCTGIVKVIGIGIKGSCIWSPSPCIIKASCSVAMPVCNFSASPELAVSILLLAAYTCSVFFGMHSASPVFAMPVPALSVLGVILVVIVPVL